CSPGNHLDWWCPCDVCRGAAPVFCRPELSPHITLSLARAPGKSGERVGQDRHSLITSGACMEPNDSVTNNPLDWRSTGCSPLAVVASTAVNTTDLREALVNDRLVGPASHIQVPREGVTRLWGLVIDLDANLLKANEWFSPGDTAETFYAAILPVLE